MTARIVAFPAGGIAYNDRLYAAFRDRGVEVVDGQWGGRWLLAQIRRDDIVHLHWPSFLYKPRGSLWAVGRSFLRFLILLVIMRLKAREVWWTAHNLMPHVPCRLPLLDRLGRRAVVAIAQRIFVHGPEARQVLVEHFPPCADKSVIIPHGHWIGHYEPCSSRDEARRRLGLPPDAFVYLLFGQCKPYKNIEGLIAAFRRVAAADHVLLIAGRFVDPAYRMEVQALAAGDARIRIQDGFIPDEQVSVYLMACNAMCIPYREILTSGTAMLALSYGRPVLSVKRGFLRDVIHPDAGVLIERGDPVALEEGMLALAARPWDEGRILEHCRPLSFDEAARISLACLERGAITQAASSEAIIR